MVILEFKHKKALEDIIEKARESQENLADIIECLESTMDHRYNDMDEDEMYNERRKSRMASRGRYGYK